MSIVRVPLRVSLCGGGTDFPAFYARQTYGVVVSLALDRSVDVVLRRWAWGLSPVRAAPLVRAVLETYGVPPWLGHVQVVSDVGSRGSGLGASSAIVVGVIKAVQEAGYADVACPEQRARMADWIERVRCQRPIGKQDAYICTYGGVRAFRFHADDTVETEEVVTTDADYHWLEERLLLFHLGDRPPADMIWNVQQHEANDAILVQIRDCAVQAREALREKDPQKLFEAVARNARWKAQLSPGIETPLIAEVRMRAREAGAWTSKICGAGGGGYLLVGVAPEERDRVRAAVALPELPIRVSREGARVLV